MTIPVIDAIPEWPTIRARFLFCEINDRGHDLPLASVTRDRGVELRSDLSISVWNPGDDISGYKRVQPGDFVIGLRSFQSGIGYSPLEGLVSPAYTVLRPISTDTDALFFKHLLKSEVVISLLENVAQGIRQGRTISAEDFLEMRLPVPPLEEQRSVAGFLDKATQRIDSLIAKKQRLVDLMSERYRAFVESCLAGWPNVPLKSVTHYVEGPGIMAEDFRDEGIPLIRVSGIGDREVSLEGCNFLEPTKVAAKWKHFRLAQGDYVISASATMGVVAEVQGEAVGAIPYTGLIRFRSASDRIHMPFVKHFLRSQSFMEQISALKTGAAMEHFGPTHLGQMKIPMPKHEDQVRLTKSMDAVREKALRIGSAVTDQVALIQERRKALITAAVTGQLEIPGVAA